MTVLALAGLAGWAVAAENPAMSELQSSILRFGGCGGVYFLAAPGELVVDLVKRDRRSERPVSVRAALFAPDRAVLSDQWLPGGSASAPVQSLRLSTPVACPGIYGLMITAADDRYGTEMTWGFRTNCPQYLVETSRGHRDARHHEPIVLASPDRAGEVCFMPRRGAFSIDLAGLAADAGPVTCVTRDGQVLATFAPGADGRASHAFPVAADRALAPWRLRFPRFQAEVAIDGVTRWDSTDDYAGLSLWTPEAASWFAFHDNRWLLTPYSRAVYAPPGSAQELAFRVHNNALSPSRVALALEFPAGMAEFATLSATEVTLAPRQQDTVRLRLHIPPQGEGWSCRLRATNGTVSTYSSITVRPGAAPAQAPLSIPLVLSPFRHENEQFGYLPDYPLDAQPYFDLANRPFIAGTALHVGRDSAWTDAVLAGPDGAAVGSLRGTKVAFDADNDAYAVATLGGAPALLHSADGGAHVAAYPIPGNGHIDIENFSGHNVPAGPPPLVRITRTASDPKLIWRSLNDLALFLPEKRAGRIVVGEPILISRRCLGISDHSGIPSSLVSRGSRVHITWGEATDPQESVPGVPTYVATYDRDTRTLGQPVLVGYGPPANDVHNSPCITMDSQGFLHVLVGTHGRTFKYARSRQPDDSAGGWTPPEDVGAGLSQTYVGLVCDRDDTLHLVFRLWQGHADRFPAGSYACLAHMRKPLGQPWSAPQPLIVAPFTDYSVYYHRLTIDRRGRLFLSYDYWSTYWFYRTDHVGNRRALLMSPDAGRTWKLADAADFASAAAAAR